MTVNENFQLKICLNDKMVLAFKESIKGKNDIPKNILACTEQGHLATVEDIEWLHANRKTSAPYLHELLEGCELKLPEPEAPPRNPELEARIQKLKAEQEDRDYKRMTRNVDNSRLKQPEDSIGFHIRQVNRQLIAVLQFVFSVAAGFMFGFIGVELFVGDLEFGFRLLLGVIFSLIIALAEIYFLAKRLAEEDDLIDQSKKPISLHPSKKLHQD